MRDVFDERVLDLGCYILLQSSLNACTYIAQSDGDAPSHGHAIVTPRLLLYIFSSDIFGHSLPEAIDAHSSKISSHNWIYRLDGWNQLSRLVVQIQPQYLFT